jgi:hypothetical protein
MTLREMTILIRWNTDEFLPKILSFGIAQILINEAFKEIAIELDVPRSCWIMDAEANKWLYDLTGSPKGTGPGDVLKPLSCYYDGEELTQKRPSDALGWADEVDMTKTGGLSFTTGTPVCFWIENRDEKKALGLYPCPYEKKADGIWFFYVRRPPNLVNLDDVSILPEWTHSLAVDHASWKALLNKDDAKAMVFKTEYDKKLLKRKAQFADMLPLTKEDAVIEIDPFLTKIRGG